MRKFHKMFKCAWYLNIAKRYETSLTLENYPTAHHFGRIKNVFRDVFLVAL